VEDKYMSSFPTDGTGEKITLTPAQKARVAARARRGLLVVLLSQVLAGLLLSLVLLLVSGWQAGLSALCGSMCYLAPNAIFVARLVLSTFRQTAAGPIVFLLGNGLKVIVAVVLLWALSRIHADWLNWLAGFAGLLVTLEGYWVAVLLTGGRITKHM